MLQSSSGRSSKFKPPRHSGASLSRGNNIIGYAALASFSEKYDGRIYSVNCVECNPGICFTLESLFSPATILWICFHSKSVPAYLDIYRK